MTVRRAAIGLLLVGVGAVLTAFVPNDLSTQLTYGASRVQGQPGIALHWVLCPGVAPRSVDVEGYSGGGLPTASVLWQIRSDEEAAERVRIETYEVGAIPTGFYETVPLRRQLPNDLVSISSPPGDASSTDGMSFKPAELQANVIYRGDYSFVTAAGFARDGEAFCRSRTGLPLPAVGLAALGLSGALLAGRRRPVAALLGSLVLATGAVIVVAPSGLSQAVEARQSASSFEAGSYELLGDHEVLVVLSAATANSRDGVQVARFLSPGSYSFAVSCSGPSLQIGEFAEIDGGSTGGRQLIGCDTPSFVTGTIAQSPDRGELVEVLIDPNGMADWRVVVVAGSGSAGPFDEP